MEFNWQHLGALIGVLVGMGALASWLFKQFKEIYADIASIRDNYVKKNECEKDCNKSMKTHELIYHKEKKNEQGNDS